MPYNNVCQWRGQAVHIPPNIPPTCRNFVNTAPWRFSFCHGTLGCATAETLDFAGFFGAQGSRRALKYPLRSKCRQRLKIPYPQGCTGSNPVTGTKSRRQGLRLFSFSGQGRPALGLGLHQLRIRLPVCLPVKLYCGANVRLIAKSDPFW